MGFFSDIGLGFLEGGGSSSASVSSTVNLNVNGLDKIHETIELAGSTTVNQHLTVDAVTVNENIDLKPVTLNENIDLKPVTLNENVDLKPVTLNENIDLKPVAVDTCQTFRLAPLPDTNVCQPYRHHISYTVFGVEYWAVSYDGESTQRIISPHHPQAVTTSSNPYHVHGRATSVTGQGIRVRVLDDNG
jgi:hypothetical protein